MFPDDGTPGINDLRNYEPGAKLDDIVGKRDKIKVYGNMFTIGLTTSQGYPLKVASRYSGFYDENGNPTDKYEGSHNFFPLDDYNTDSKINGSKTYGKLLADDSREWHNMLFGMRFDVMFNTDQYSDLSKMNFHFSGDDDLWVFVDGKLALDVGGNHGEIPGSVDIGNYIDKDEVGKNHQLTVLYLERGGNYSNCAVSFTLPTTNAMEFKRLIRQMQSSGKSIKNSKAISERRIHSC